jgi:hypothetical protein
VRGEGLTEASINRYTACIRRVFNLALEWEAYEGINRAVPEEGGAAVASLWLKSAELCTHLRVRSHPPECSYARSTKSKARPTEAGKDVM